MQEKEKGKIDAASFGAGYAFGYLTAVRDLRDRIAVFMQREYERAIRQDEDYRRGDDNEKV